MTKRPELGKLTVGQKVVVYRSPDDMRGRKKSDREIPAHVAKIGRTWVQLNRDDHPDFFPSDWRMRMDVQNEATQYGGSNASFATLEQHAWDEANRWGCQMLTENGITLEFRSPWRGQEHVLADLILKGSKA